MANTISVNVVADVNNIRGSLNNVNTQLNGFQRTASKVGGALKGMFAGAAILGGAAALGSFFQGAIEEGREAAKVTALTEQVIKSMGNSAGISAAGVGKLAESLSNKTAIDDEVIQSGANLVLTFGNIKNAAGAGNDVFNQTVAAANDMSVALGQDMKSSSIQLGKALNDPIKGVTALTRVGVAFTEQQKTQIASMVAAGDTLGAQKVILAEVNKQFGGAAEAAATPMEKLKVSIGNLKESIGTALIPILDRMATYIVGKLPGWIETAKGAFDTFKTAVAAVAPVLIPLGEALAKVGGFVKDNFAFFGPFAAVLLTVAAAVKVWAAAQVLLNIALTANPIGLVVVAVALLVGAFVLAYKQSETFRNIVNAAFNGIKVVAQAVFAYISLYIKTVFNVIVGIATGDSARVKDAISNAWNAVKNVTSLVWNGLKSIISDVWPAIRSAVASGLASVTAALISGWNSAKATVSAAWIAIRAAVAQGVSNVVSAVRALPGAIAGALGNLGSLLTGAGRSVVQGLIDGIGGMFGAAVAKAKALASAVKDSVKGALGINSPSRVFKVIGQQTVQGLEVGLRDLSGVKDSGAAMAQAVATGYSRPNLELAVGAYGSAQAGMGGGNTYYITNEVPPNVDMAQVGKATVDAIKSYERQNGNRWRVA